MDSKSNGSKHCYGRTMVQVDVSYPFFFFFPLPSLCSPSSLLLSPFLSLPPPFLFPSSSLPLPSSPLPFPAFLPSLKFLPPLSFLPFLLSPSSFGEGNGSIYHVSCTGLEHNLNDCTYSSPASNHCSHSDDIGVRCTSKIPYLISHAYHMCCNEIGQGFLLVW